LSNLYPGKGLRELLWENTLHCGTGKRAFNIKAVSEHREVSLLLIRIAVLAAG
jgi:hypothetical protein